MADAAAENDFNTIELEDGVKSDIAERAIATQIEGPASQALLRISRGGWLEDDEERSVVALFLALQYVRVPLHRDKSNAMADQLLKLDIAAGGPAKLREVLEATEGRPVTDAEVKNAWDAVRDFDDWGLDLGRQHHVLNMLEMAEEFGPGLFEHYDWAVTRWQRKHLLTCDAPVILVPDPQWPEWRGVGLYTAGTIYFPVDRSTALGP